MESTHDSRMNHTKNTMISSFLEEISQNMTTYPAHMTGLNILLITFIKSIKAVEPRELLFCIEGTTLRSIL